MIVVTIYLTFNIKLAIVTAILVNQEDLESRSS